jgi:hypothetical protein
VKSLGVRIDPRTGVIAIGLCVVASYSVFLLPTDSAKQLSGEDGVFEYGTAICFAVTSCILTLTWLKHPQPNDFFVFKTRRNVFLLLLALLFFFGAGEEISWGQRIFGIETPDAIDQINVQGEMNIHNLSIFDRTEDGMDKTGLSLLFTIERLFSLFWLTYCFLVPLLSQFSAAVASFLERINLPMVPLWLGIYFPLNYLISRLIETLLINNGIRFAWQVSEVKEFIFSALFLVLAIVLNSSNSVTTNRHSTSG